MTSSMKIGTRLMLGFLTAIIFLIVSAVASFLALRSTEQGMETIYNDRVVPLGQLKIIADAYAVGVIDAVNKTNAGLFTAEEALKAVQLAQQQIKTEWAAYAATKLTVEEERLAKEAVALFARPTATSRAWPPS